MQQASLFTSEADIKKDFDERLRKGDIFDCPCCGRHSQIYRRKITGAMIFAAMHLIKLQRESADGYVHHSKFLEGISRGFYDLKYFGFIEQKQHNAEAADQRTSGFWRVLPKGILFIRGEMTAPKYALTFDDTCLGFTGDHVNIHQCLPEKFSYAEVTAFIGAV